MIVKMHRSVNITYIYVNGYCLVVRLSCQLEPAVIQNKDVCRVGWSWIELTGVRNAFGYSEQSEYISRHKQVLFRTLNNKAEHTLGKHHRAEWFL